MNHSPSVVAWTKLMLDSYRHWTKTELFRRVSPEMDDSILFEFGMVIVAHGVEPDPILKYGNRRALILWEMTWDVFTKTPSRQTAEPQHQAERQRFLNQVERKGFSQGYRGIRISASGRRFEIEDVCLWKVRDEHGKKVGLAAKFNPPHVFLP